MRGLARHNQGHLEEGERRDMMTWGEVIRL